MKNHAATRPLPRILLVEDDASTREGAGIKLQKSGFSVAYAEDGAIALAMLKKDSNFSAILLDLWMPKSDGFEFLQKKMEDPALRDVPVVVFSNLSQPEHVKRVLALGARGYLVKAQHSIEEIVVELKKCIEGGECKIDQ